MKKVILVVCALLILFSLAGCGDTGAKEEKSSKKENTDKVIFQDDTVTATFKGVKDVDGYLQIMVKLKNKSDSEITVLPMDSVVNDTTVQLTSGVPATIEPNTSFNQVWMVPLDKIGIDSAKDVKNIKFSLYYNDAQTDVINIDL